MHNVCLTFLSCPSSNSPIEYMGLLHFTFTTTLQSSLRTGIRVINILLNVFSPPPLKPWGPPVVVMHKTVTWVSCVGSQMQYAQGTIIIAYNFYSSETTMSQHSTWPVVICFTLHLIVARGHACTAVFPANTMYDFVSQRIEHIWFVIVWSLSDPRYCTRFRYVMPCVLMLLLVFLMWCCCVIVHILHFMDFFFCFILWYCI